MQPAEQVRTDVNTALSVLADRNLLAAPPNYAIRRQVGPHCQVTWPAAPKDTLRGKFGRFATAGEYRYLVEHRQFNAVLSDGALLMLAYTFSLTGEMESHNLYYYPCPLDLAKDAEHEDGDDVEARDDMDFTFIDRFDELLDEEFRCARLETDIYRGTCDSRLLMRAPLRFDYAPDHAADGHAASHVHVSHPDCRIPVYGAVSVGHFIRFVLTNYYPGWMEACGDFANVPEREYGRELLDAHRGVLHIDWLTGAERRQEGLFG